MLLFLIGDVVDANEVPPGVGGTLRISLQGLLYLLAFMRRCFWSHWTGSTLVGPLSLPRLLALVWRQMKTPDNNPRYDEPLALLRRQPPSPAASFPVVCACAASQDPRFPSPPWLHLAVRRDRWASGPIRFAFHNGHGKWDNAGGPRVSACQAPWLGMA